MKPRSSSEAGRSDCGKGPELTWWTVNISGGLWGPWHEPEALRRYTDTPRFTVLARGSYAETLPKSDDGFRAVPEKEWPGIRGTCMLVCSGNSSSFSGKLFVPSPWC